MSNESYQPRKIFTLEEANASLPLVRAIARDLVDLTREVIERRERLSHLMAGRKIERDDPYSSELVQIKEELEKDAVRLQEYVDELRQLGVEPKNGADGLVDFPAEMDGRIVFLCWKLDEPEVLFWHELEAGFRGRQPLVAGTLAEEGLDGSLDEGGPSI